MITVNYMSGTDLGQPVLQPQVGTVLTASLTDEDVVPVGTDDDPNPEWQWYRGSTEISGATNAAYEPVEADVGNRLTAKATYMDNEDDANEKEAEARTYEGSAGSAWLEHRSEVPRSGYQYAQYCRQGPKEGRWRRTRLRG